MGLVEDPDERIALADFLGVLHSRLPGLMDDVDKIQGGFVGALVERAMKHPDWRKKARVFLSGRMGKEVSEEDLDELLEPGELEFSVDRNTLIGLILELAAAVTDALLAMQWRVVRPASTHLFLASDMPITLVAPVDLPSGLPLGFGTPGVVVFCPLGLMAAAVGSRYPLAHADEMPADVVEDHNYQTTVQSERHVFSPFSEDSVLIEIMRELPQREPTMMMEPHPSDPDRRIVRSTR